MRTGPKTVHRREKTRVFHQDLHSLLGMKGRGVGKGHNMWAPAQRQMRLWHHIWRRRGRRSVISLLLPWPVWLVLPRESLLMLEAGIMWWVGGKEARGGDLLEMGAAGRPQTWCQDEGIGIGEEEEVEIGNLRKCGLIWNLTCKCEHETERESMRWKGTLKESLLTL